MPRSFQLLVVDDHEDHRLLTRLLLERRGHTVREAGTAQEALAILVERRIDFVITDLMMPEVSGVDLAAVVKRAFPSVPVIFMTAAAPQQTLVQASALGRVLIKGTSLIARLEETLGRAATS